MKDYPEKFRPLISAVSKESSGYANVWVDFEAVRPHVGKGEVEQKLGWTTYTRYVQDACEAGHLQMKIVENNSKRIKLVAPHVNLNQMEDHVSYTHNNKNMCACVPPNSSPARRE